MLAKTSKEVVKRQQTCQFLLTALATQGPQISDLLTERVRPFLGEGDLEPSAHVLHVALTRFLEGNMGVTVRADEAVYMANAELTALRKERRRMTRRLGRQVIRLRTIVVSHYRAPLLEHLGLGTQTSRRPVPLLRQADRITEAFTDEELQAHLGSPYRAGEEPPHETVAELGTQAEALRDLLHRVDETVRQHDVALGEKNRHLADHDLVYTYTARTFEAICRLAGRAELAERVRRTIRRTRQQAADTEVGSTVEPGNTEAIMPRAPEVPETPALEGLTEV